MQPAVGPLDLHHAQVLEDSSLIFIFGILCPGRWSACLYFGMDLLHFVQECVFLTPS
jgi:hypothetical protein